MPYFRVNGMMVHLKLSGRAKSTKPCVATIEIDGKACRCMGISTALCDWTVEGGTCDAPLCEQHAHAHPTKANTDYCPRHWHKYRESEPELF